jgi:hypothetical protein
MILGMEKWLLSRSFVDFWKNLGTNLELIISSENTGIVESNQKEL